MVNDLMLNINNTLTYVTFIFNPKTDTYLPLDKTFPFYHKSLLKLKETPKGLIIKFSVPEGTISVRNKRKKIGIKMTDRDNYYIQIHSGRIENHAVESIVEKLPSNLQSPGIRLFLRTDPEEIQKIPFTLEEANIIVQAVNSASNKVCRASVIDRIGLIVSNDVDIIPVEKQEKVEVEKEYFHVEKEVNHALYLVSSLVEKTGYGNILLVGPSGYGKTTLASKLAEKLGKPFLKVDISLITEPQEIFGSLGLVNGSTVFTETAFAKAIKQGGHVILLDEINRAYPNVLNPLLPLLDDTRSASYNGTTYNVAPETLFVVTANIGSRFTGTFQSDSALMNRMNYVAKVGLIPSDVESKIYCSRTGVSKNVADTIVKVLFHLRETFGENSSIDFSPRLGIAVSHACVFGFSIRSAFMSCLSHIDINDKRMLTDILGTHGITESTEKLLF